MADDDDKTCMVDRLGNKASADYRLVHMAFLKFTNPMNNYLLLLDTKPAILKARRLT